MLSNCNISGSIPDYVANMHQLTILDLSFNKLEGNISNLEGLKRVTFMYLTGNLLTGPIPEWINNRDDQIIDLSYNNFTETSVLPSCTSKTLNLFRSFPRWINLEFDKCTPCLEDLYSLHINCGGEEATIGETTYEADEDPRGSVPEKENWGISTTGRFWDINVTASDYIAKNVSVLVGNDTRLLYTRARLSPLSLTYYGHCFADGNYTVSLHFAEIIIRENQSFQSLGRRIFDIYIQDELVRKDFDIVQEAQGVDKAVVLKFNSVVKEKTLEIRFHWAGKGTTIVPTRGTYGPLISAISVESNFKPPSDGKRKIFTVIIGSIASVSFLIFTTLGIFWWRGCPGSSISSERDLRGLDLQTGLFTFRQIETATDNFHEANKIGEGGFGSVYKGILLDGTVIAVKQLSSKSKQGNREFVNEIGLISGLQHPNLVRLYGCCIEENQLLLVYEYMENNSLALALFGPKELQLKLDWPTRQRICVGIAKGLVFLHEESTLKIVHRDIKTTNVLLDRDLNPKISDFGLAKLHDEENTHISTRVAGTAGYMAPEYAQWGYLTYKADVYSFGIVALEIVAGKNNMKYHPSENDVCLLDWALALQQKGCLLELVDPKLDSNFNEEEALRMIQGALLCTNPSPALRPTMSALVSMLEGRISVQNIITDPSIYSDELRFKALKGKYEAGSSESKTFIDSSEATRYGSSTTSARDLYEINLDSQ
ncbi:probable LRR receptor-like serine/threonine-protein kinase At1g07650 isoform X2 [Cornus florida]|nr:probable LRR receptor-like serine/threonine-protein kinase At1g07650 isoform X2 [Cornus florida]